MNKLREAAKLALEALETNDKLINGDGKLGGLEFAMDGYYRGSFDIEGTNQKTDAAIAALRAALSEDPRTEIIDGLAEQGARQLTDLQRAIKDYMSILPDYERGVIDGMQRQMQSSVDKAVNAMCKRREWVSLTDEEICDLWTWSASKEAELTANTQQHAFARAIEANLKEKNS